MHGMHTWPCVTYIWTMDNGTPHARTHACMQQQSGRLPRSDRSIMHHQDHHQPSVRPSWHGLIGTREKGSRPGTSAVRPARRRYGCCAIAVGPARSIHPSNSDLLQECNAMRARFHHRQSIGPSTATAGRPALHPLLQTNHHDMISTISLSLSFWLARI